MIISQLYNTRSIRDSRISSCIGSFPTRFSSVQSIRRFERTGTRRTTRSDLKLRHDVLNFNLLVCVFRNVDLSRYARGLRPAGQIHGVAEQTVPRHPVTDHAGDHLAAVYAYCYALRIIVKKKN